MRYRAAATPTPTASLAEVVEEARAELALGVLVETVEDEALRVVETRAEVRATSTMYIPF